MWYNKIVANLGEIPNFISYYEHELEIAKMEIAIRGNVSKHISDLPGITERYFTQLQEIEAVLNYMNIQLRKIKQKHFKQYLEGYNRALTSRDAERYSDSESEVIDYECLINEVALIRNKYLSILKSLESKNFMLGHLVKLKVAGMEDFST
jgi:hypothetical protein